MKNIPKNWTFIRFLLETLDKYDEVSWIDIRPRGRAKNYMGHYIKVWDNLDKYAERNGMKIKYVPGPRGGRWRSKWVKVE